MNPLLGILLTLLTTGYNSNKSIENLTINAEIICVGYDSYAENEHMCVKVTIRNNSDSTKTLHIFNCSWQESFITDIEDITFCGKICSPNAPDDLTLSPKDSITFTAIISVPYLAHKFKSFKIGFVDMNESELKSSLHIGNPKTRDEALKLRRKYLLTLKTFWSNSLLTDYNSLGYTKKNKLN
jgi:hypothetical protein